MKRKFLILLAVMVVVCWLPGQAMAVCITLDSTHGYIASFSVSGTNTTTTSKNPLSAKAIFTFTPGNVSTSTPGTLEVQLINTEDITGTSIRLEPSDILTGLFFSPSTTLIPSSATTTGSTIVITGGTATGSVGQHWAYEGGLSAAPNGATAGISASGLGLFSSGNFAAGGITLSGATGFELAPLGYTGVVSQGNPAVLAMDSLVVNENDFFLILDAGVTSLTLCDLSFQYGTALADPNLVPLPGALLLLGAGLVRLAAHGRRKRKGT